MSVKAIIWDFDGTLVLHKGLWSGTMMAALDTLIRDHNMSVECLTPYLHTGFPWHEAGKAHPELSYPGAWWNRMEGYLETIFEKVGFEEKTASALAQKTHEIYVDEKRYEIFPNSIETLSRLKNAGWRNVILSNHVPELPDIVDKLGFSAVIEECFTSALIGYEKPNIMAFRYVLDYLRHPNVCIMIGDSVTSDIKGADNAGIIPILLHTAPPDETFNYCKTIDEIEGKIDSMMSRM